MESRSQNHTQLQRWGLTRAHAANCTLTKVVKMADDLFFGQSAVWKLEMRARIQLKYLLNVS